MIWCEWFIDNNVYGSKSNKRELFGNKILGKYCWSSIMTPCGIFKYSIILLSYDLAHLWVYIT